MTSFLLTLVLFIFVPLSICEQKCSFRGQCGNMTNSYGLNLPIPCVYDDKPLPFKNSDKLKILKPYVPELVDGSDSVFCCDDTQVDKIVQQLSIPHNLLGRCPSCFFNFARIFFIMTCSPHQHDFIRVTDFETNDHGKMVKALSYYMTKELADGIWSSCIDVQMPSAGVRVLPSMLCKTQDCTPERFFSSIGKHDPSPIQIDFHLMNTNTSEFEPPVIPNSVNYTKCSETASSFSSQICSCTDCQSVCPKPQPLPSDPPEWKLFGLSGISVLAGVGYSVIFVISVISFIIYHRCGKDELENLMPEESSSKEELDQYRTVPKVNQPLIHNKVCQAFGWYGELCARKSCHLLLPLLGLLIAIVLSIGTIKFNPITDPIQLWSTATSRARIEKDHFDGNFGPFFRVENVVITPTNLQNITYQNRIYGPALNQTFLLRVLELQEKILDLKITDEKGKVIRINDLCFSPMNNHICMVQSAVGWFQDKKSLIERSDYLTHIDNCISSPFSFADSLNISCMANYQGPVFPHIALADFEGKDYQAAKALVFTVTLNNAIKPEDNKNALEWEKKFLTFLKDYNDSTMTLAFYSERSIEDELDRLSKSNVATVAISYLVMFLYITISLGDYVSFKRLLIDSKLMVGLCGVSIVLLSVLASIGLLCYIGVRSTLIIIEVIPFLVLAVGVDNIFILVQHFARIRLSQDEMQSLSYDQALQLRMRRLMSSVAPSILLAACAESSCFFLGALTPMPAVRIFAINAGIALLIAFVFQMLIFVPILALDARRQDQNRYEILYCIQSKKTFESEDVSNEELHNEGQLYLFFSKVYAPFLMKNWVRLVVVLIFSAWLCISISVVHKIEVGLEQKMSMPLDSYVLDFFDAQINKLKVGPPVYFVVEGEIDYSMHQDLFCGRAGCSPYSAVAILSQAANESDSSYIVSSTPNSWIDDYLDWASSSQCCRIRGDNPLDGPFCPSTDNTTSDCWPCQIYDEEKGQISTDLGEPVFYRPFLKYFLSDTPNVECPKGGGPNYMHAINMQINETNYSHIIRASYYMTYHVPLQHSKDFTKALKNARVIAQNIEESINSRSNHTSNVHVYPYSFFYVFYEQYLTVWHDTLVNILFALLAIFLVTFLFLSFNLVVSLVIVATIVSIILNLMGLMYFWNISLNAVSLVNLVMGIGISVEFCSHVARATTLSSHHSKVSRATYGLAEMGSSVMSGITMTKFFGIIILAFSPSKIFQVFYFRMYMGIVMIGAVHGLILLPVLLSIVGSSFKYRC